MSAALIRLVEVAGLAVLFTLYLAARGWSVDLRRLGRAAFGDDAVR